MQQARQLLQIELGDLLRRGMCLDPVDKSAQTNVGIGDPERLASRFSFVIQENHLV